MVLGVSITTSTRKQILSYCSSVFLKSTKQSSTFPITIVTPNAEQIVLAQDNDMFRQILNASDVALPDGKPITWVLKKEVSKMERIAGIDFMEELCKLAANHQADVFLFGGNDGVAARALSHLQKKYVGLMGIAKDGPTIQETDISESVIDELVHTIRGRNIRVVFLGFGAPKQEYIIDALNKRVRGYPVILMAVGGSFDFLSGTLVRAPLFFQKIGLEWLWRLTQEPWRWKRQLSLFKFLWYIFLSKK